MKPIYKPDGAAGEYGDLAINIYTGCNHGCTYCYAAKNFKRWHPNDDFTHVEPRPGIVDAVRAQLTSSGIRDKLIHLCFSCDPYPAPPVDTMSTREIIRAIKDSGNHVQILTKGGIRACRDFNLLDSGDWFGVTLTGCASPTVEPFAAGEMERIGTLRAANRSRINTWVSCEPVLDAINIYDLIRVGCFIDLFKIGKLNYHQSDINWREFGHECERLCRQYGRDYYIKDSLQKEMEGSSNV